MNLANPILQLQKIPLDGVDQSYKYGSRLLASSVFSQIIHIIGLHLSKYCFSELGSNWHIFGAEALKLKVNNVRWLKTAG